MKGGTSCLDVTSFKTSHNHKCLSPVKQCYCIGISHVLKSLSRKEKVRYNSPAWNVFRANDTSFQFGEMHHEITSNTNVSDLISVIQKGYRALIWVTKSHYYCIVDMQVATLVHLNINNAIKSTVEIFTSRSFNSVSWPSRPSFVWRHSSCFWIKVFLCIRIYFMKVTYILVTEEIFNSMSVLEFL